MDPKICNSSATEMYVPSEDSSVYWSRRSLSSWTQVRTTVLQVHSVAPAIWERAWFLSLGDWAFPPRSVVDLNQLGWSPSPWISASDYKTWFISPKADFEVKTFCSAHSFIFCDPFRPISIDNAICNCEITPCWTFGGFWQFLDLVPWVNQDLQHSMCEFPERVSRVRKGIHQWRIPIWRHQVVPGASRSPLLTQTSIENLVQ